MDPFCWGGFFFSLFRLWRWDMRRIRRRWHMSVGLYVSADMSCANPPYDPHEQQHPPTPLPPTPTIVVVIAAATPAHPPHSYKSPSPSHSPPSASPQTRHTGSTNPSNTPGTHVLASLLIAQTARLRTDILVREIKPAGLEAGAVDGLQAQAGDGRRWGWARWS